MRTIGTFGNLEVSVNDTDEVFVKNTFSGVTIRISDQSLATLVVTSHGNRISPTSINGLDAFRISSWELKK